MSIEIHNMLFNMSKLKIKIQLIDNFHNILINCVEMSSFSKKNLLLKNTNMLMAG